MLLTAIKATRPANGPTYTRAAVNLTIEPVILHMVNRSQLLGDLNYSSCHTDAVNRQCLFWNLVVLGFWAHWWQSTAFNCQHQFSVKSCLWHQWERYLRVGPLSSTHVSGVNPSRNDSLHLIIDFSLDLTNRLSFIMEKIDFYNPNFSILCSAASPLYSVTVMLFAAHLNKVAKLSYMLAQVTMVRR